MPSRWATAAASTRVWVPSLPRMLDTCTVAVLGLMKSASAIWRLVRPAATSASTSRSRGVRPSASSGDGCPGAEQDRSARVVIAGHALVQNIRRGHDELAVGEPTNRRLAVAFEELILAI
jgi:hypothetical protein